MKSYYVYIPASGRRGTLYTGVTGDLPRRITEHRQGLVDGFTRKYQVDRLVFYEETDDTGSAIQREKQLKAWKRQWKIELIEKYNPPWRDLAEDFLEKS